MERYTANGTPLVAICCNCGAGLTYPIDILVNGVVKTYGSDCASRVFGFNPQRCSEFMVNGVFDFAAYEAHKAAKQEAALAAAREHADRCAAYADRNAFIIDALMPYGCESSYDQ